MLTVIAGSLTAILAAAALFGWGREALRHRMTTRAELAAYALQVAGSDPAAWARADQRQRDRLAARERALSLAWRTGIDEQIAEINAAFDVLQHRTQSTFAMLLDRATTHSAEHLIDLARVSPRAALREVRRANAIPTPFSWHTTEYPIVARHPATLRPARRRNTRHRALDLAEPSPTL